MTEVFRGSSGAVYFMDQGVPITSWEVKVEPPCPFSILDDFDNWFEWWRRVEYLGQPHRLVTLDMQGPLQPPWMHSQPQSVIMMTSSGPGRLYHGAD